MNLRTSSFLLLLSFAGLGADGPSAQEPAYYANNQAARFPSSPGYFHYILPCLQTLRTVGSVGAGDGKPQPALCWPVRVALLQKVDGKYAASTILNGLFLVSGTQFQFNPVDEKDIFNRWTLVPDKVNFQHIDGTGYGLIQLPSGSFQFIFSDVCMGCDPKTAAVEQKGRQTDEEYKMFGESLKRFDGVAKRVQEIAARVRVEVLPGNQPTLEDPPEAMHLYATLNHVMGQSCPEAARACLRSYEDYQTCESKDRGGSCGAPPACSATCALDRQSFAPLKATTCTSRARDSASLIPDWTPVLEQAGIKPSAPPASARVASGEKTGYLGGPLGGGTKPCSVFSAYEIAWMTHQMPPMGAIGSSSGGGAGTGPGYRVSAGIMQGNLVSSVNPIYPAAARAAHIAGVVILRGVISAEGDVTELSVVSGPSLLQSAAMDAVRQWKYKPYLRDGKAVAVDTTVTVHFTLVEGKAAPAAN